MSDLSQIAYPALSQRYALDFIQIVDLIPDFIEANELDHNLLGLLDGVKISLSVVFNGVDFFSPSLLYLSVLRFRGLTLFEVVLDLFEIIIDILGVMKFFCSEISFEKCSFQSIAKLNLFVFDHGAHIVRAREVLIAVHCSVVFSSIQIIPFNTNPQLILGSRRFPRMQERSEISHDSCAIIE